MSAIRQAFERFSAASRASRAKVFRESFDFDVNTRLLDLGSEDGSNIANVIDGLGLRPANVYIADIDKEAIEKGSDKFGFVPVPLFEGGELAYEDGFFDIVFCSSVIEHVTVPKDEVWGIQSSREFRAQSSLRQQDFANQIRRLGRQYFVQTPNRGFPLESHTWLPFAGQMPREVFVPFLKMTNAFWPKQSIPDFHLLSPVEMQKLFPEARIMLERKFRLAKSIMAIKSEKSDNAANG